MTRTAAAKPGERGFAMLLVFVMAAAIAITLYMEMPRVAFESQRTKEQLAIDRGLQYQRAIQLFYRKYQLYPQTLDDLETTRNIRFLRHRYLDPLTGKEWRLLHVGPAGQLTDSLVQPAAPLGGSGAAGTPLPDSGRGNAQQASNTPPQGDGSNPNDPNAQQADPLDMAAKRPSDRILLPSRGFQPPPEEPAPEEPEPEPQPPQDPEQPAVPVQQPGVPGQPGLPGQSGVPGQPGLPGQPAQPGDPSQPGQPGQPPVGFPPGINPAQTGVPGQPASPLNPANPGQNPTPFQPASPTFPGQQAGQRPVFPGQPGAPGTPGQPQSAQNLIQQILTTPRQPPASIQGFTSGNTGGIAGVASTAPGKGIHVINSHSKYKEWEFVYDLKKDKNVVGAAGVNALQNAQQQMQQNQNGGPLGNSPFSSSPSSTPGSQPNLTAPSPNAPTAPPPNQ